MSDDCVSGYAEAVTEPFHWTILASLLRPQGRRGEVLADLLTDFPERFQDHPNVYLAATGFSGMPERARALQVTSSWLPVGRNQGRIVLEFAGVHSIEEAQALCGANIVIPSEDRPALEDDAEYVDALIGCTVFDEGIAIGTIRDVEFSTSADGSRKLEDVAPLLLVMTAEGHEVMIPFAQAYLDSQDVAGKEIRMRLPPGLLDLNL